MTTDEQPVKPAINESGYTLILDIGTDSYVLDPAIEVDTAVKLMRVLALGCRKRCHNWDATTEHMIESVGPREVIALQMAPVGGSEVAK